MKNNIRTSADQNDDGPGQVCVLIKNNLKIFCTALNPET